MKKFASHLVIIIFGLFFGYFIWQSFYRPLSLSYPLSWKSAYWITTPTMSPVGLFRKELFIANSLSDSWIQISAPDTYELTINGKKVVENTFYSSNVSGVHDITSYLRPGKNVIAVSVRRLNFPGPSKVVVKGKYTDISSNETAFSSDSTWKVFNREDIRGDISWTSPAFDASSWPSALTMEEPKIGETYPVVHSPRAITSALSAKWIRYPAPCPEKANFRKDFVLSDKPLDGWVRITANTEYNVIVNGTEIGSGSATNTLDTYFIAALLRKGNNVIEVSIKNPQQITYALYLDGEILGEKFTFPISTDSDWNTYLPNNSKSEQPFVIGNYLSYQYSIRPKVTTEIMLPFNYEVKRFLIAFCCIGLTLLFTYIVIILVSKGMSHFTEFSFNDYFSIASFILVIPLILIVFLCIMQFDINTELRDIFNSRNVFGILFFILFLQIVVSVGARRYRIKDCKNAVAISRDSTKYKRFLVVFALLVIILLGAFLRFDDLGYISLNGDEIGTVRYAQGILKKGYPYITIGNIDKPSTTYELLPYPVAASIGVLGINSNSIRLPSALSGIANIFLIFWLGTKFVNVRTGLLASAIYAFMPLEINLARNARYMAEEQFLTMLSCYFYYKAIEKVHIDKRSVYLAAIFFVLGYLTWEGSGYILPCFLVATFIIKGRDFSWLKSWHLWLASAGASIIVLIQLDYRTYWNVPFMILGSGLSDATFKLMFLTQVYNPWYYVNNFLLTQNHIFLTFLVIVGLPIILLKKELRYLFIIFFCVIFFFSNTFSLYATRYAHFIQPFLIIMGSAVLLKLAEQASNMVKGFSMSILNSQRYIIPFMLSLMLLMATNDYIVKLYRLSPNPAPVENPVALDLRAIAEGRLDLYSIDFRGSNQFVKDNLQDGDVVVTVYTHPTLFYVGKADYFEETIIDTQIVYLDNNNNPRLVNKTVDIPTITDLPSFQRFLSDHKRVWFVASSFDLFNYLNEKDFITYFLKTMKPVHESYRARVYLWENGSRI